MNKVKSLPRARRQGVLLLYVLVWLLGSAVIGVPVLRALGTILDQMSLGMRLAFYAMPPLLAGMLVLGVLQIVAMYRYWFGGSSPGKKG